ncbi:hypothetical protein ACXC9Q_06235 [Kribbella sp. CWNU-51]
MDRRMGEPRCTHGFSTDPAARFQPRLTLRTRLTPYMFGVTIALLIVAGVAIAQVIQA